MPLFWYLIEQYGPTCAFMDGGCQSHGVFNVDFFPVARVPLVLAAVLASFNNDARAVDSRDSGQTACRAVILNHLKN